MRPLTTAQAAALHHVRVAARAHHANAVARIAAATGMAATIPSAMPSPMPSVMEATTASAAAVHTDSRITSATVGTATHLEHHVEELTSLIRDHARVTLNFHPDRLLADGRTVAESLCADGRYRSQYETGLSNGSRTAYPGGDRDGWEERLFGGAYHAPGVTAGDRPRYGGLNLMKHPDGACPRYGSCHVRLRSAVHSRATYCFGDSHVGPDDIGTIDAFAPVLAGLCETARDTGRILGVTGADPVAVLHELPGPDRPVRNGRALDEYIEVQVHGPVDLHLDAEALVLDPSFRGTRTGALLLEAAARHGIAVEWHEGFRLRAEDLDDEFRGPVMRPLALRVCAEFAGPDGRLDAQVLGRAAASVVTTPPKWAEWGTRDEVLQYVKQLWHCLVWFGEPDR
ncbi:DUF3626 domain-containing protein [Streptomyces sp. PSKA54]|uniref:DUF3626 domain-containing protein n=1 Tax=Streptomyces himalayensis subsp. aureolus TaxID=2758039 RepID=A0A7W2HIW4_9ACTN|nr:DUF3626 domain-containing protein [Streptomyces himalayensis]MBA4865470.1 DUF3626 domain-containing protein [Streptomyces himalayensis subsp. aureolus]